MTVTLRPHQREGASFLASNLVAGEAIRFGQPTGTGKTITVASAVKGKRALFVSNSTEMRQQFLHIAAEVGVKIEAASGNEALHRTEAVDVVILCESYNRPGNELARARIEAAMVKLGAAIVIL